MSQLCEGCGTKQANFGTPTERKKRWCAACGKAHRVVNLKRQKMCEGCGTKHAGFGTPTERKKRWCAGCGKAHGAVNLSAHMCEGCGTKHASFGTPTERKKRWCGECGTAHGAVNLGTHMCEGCGTKHAGFGTPTERKKRWCRECGKAHDAVSLQAHICEGCGTKHASFGTPTERKKRWCGECGKAHGAVPMRNYKMCEGCGTKHASFGTLTERKKRWCGECGKAHGAVNVSAHMCEGCSTKHASFGMPAERKARWCGGCGKAHGAVYLSALMCEGCGTKQANFGRPTERKRRWCAGCGKAHGAVRVQAQADSFGNPPQSRQDSNVLQEEGKEQEQEQEKAAAKQHEEVAEQQEQQQEQEQVDAPGPTSTGSISSSTSQQTSCTASDLEAETIEKTAGTDSAARSRASENARVNAGSARFLLNGRVQSGLAARCAQCERQIATTNNRCVRLDHCFIDGKYVCKWCLAGGWSGETCALGDQCFNLRTPSAQLNDYAASMCSQDYGERLSRTSMCCARCKYNANRRSKRNASKATCLVGAVPASLAMGKVSDCAVCKGAHRAHTSCDRAQKQQARTAPGQSTQRSSRYEQRTKKRGSPNYIEEPGHRIATEPEGRVVSFPTTRAELKQEVLDHSQTAAGLDVNARVHDLAALATGGENRVRVDASTIKHEVHEQPPQGPESELPHIATGVCDGSAQEKRQRPPMLPCSEAAQGGLQQPPRKKHNYPQPKPREIKSGQSKSTALL
eukprot:COSAG06_NODE_4003_length_4670_cov_882.870488_2_plen_742_part_00